MTVTILVKNNIRYLYSLYNCAYSITTFHRNYNNNNIYFIMTYRNTLVQRLAELY